MTDLRFVFNKQLNLLGCHQGSKADLLEAMRWVEAGRIKPVVNEVLPLRSGAAPQEIETQGYAPGVGAVLADAPRV